MRNPNEFILSLIQINKLIFKENNEIEINDIHVVGNNYGWIYQSKSVVIENLKNKFI